MATKSTNRCKAKVWTETMTSEIDGSIDAAIPSIFYGVKTEERRNKVIEELQRINVKMTEHEKKVS